VTRKKEGINLLLLGSDKRGGRAANISIFQRRFHKMGSDRNIAEGRVKKHKKVRQ